MARVLALVLALSLFTGCAGTTGKMFGGGALATTGVVLMAHHEDHNCGGAWESSECDGLFQPNDDGINTFTTLVGLGLIVLGGGLIITAHEEEAAPPVMVPVRPTPAVVAVAPMPEPDPDASPADLVLRQSVENRLAIQASLAAKSGQCEAAIATGNALAARDPDLYVKLLMADPPLEACYDAQMAAAQRM